MCAYRLQRSPTNSLAIPFQQQKVEAAKPVIVSMVAILVTPQLRTLLSSHDLLSHITTTKTVSTIPHATLFLLPEPLSSLTPLSLHLSHKAAAQELLPPPPPPPALVKRRKELAAALEAQSYAEATRDLTRLQASARVDDLRLARLPAQMSLAANVVVSMATCFAVGFFLGRAWGGNVGALVGGLVGMIGAMAVESILVGVRLWGLDKQITETKDKENKQLRRQTDQHMRDARTKEHAN